MINRSLSPYTHEVIAIGKESFDVEKDSSLYRMLTELEDRFSKISNSTSLKKIGFSIYEKLFAESLMNLNAIYKDSFKNSSKLKYPHYLPYTLVNSQNTLDERFCRLKFQESVLKLCINFIALYKKVDVNEDSNLLEEYQSLCEKIYEECFLNLVNREELGLKLDLYNWLIVNNFQSKPRPNYSFLDDLKESNNLSKDLAEHFTTHGSYIVSKIIESVVIADYDREDFRGDKYTESLNNINMPNPLNDKYAELAMQVDNIVKILR